MTAMTHVQHIDITNHHNKRFKDVESSNDLIARKGGKMREGTSCDAISHCDITL